MAKAILVGDANDQTTWEPDMSMADMSLARVRYDDTQQLMAAMVVADLEKAAVPLAKLLNSTAEMVLDLPYSRFLGYFQQFREMDKAAAENPNDIGVEIDLSNVSARKMNDVFSAMRANKIDHLCEYLATLVTRLPSKYGEKDDPATYRQMFYDDFMSVTHALRNSIKKSASS
jgi:hypothetical protein